MGCIRDDVKNIFLKQYPDQEKSITSFLEWI